MGSLIKLLDNDTINKIAAGEVIENPKSIIKELVENSIDAKATEIIVEIKNGGKKYIKISDNGIGISNNQIEDAFKRHYTSKINVAEDLENINTLGFRGEALASIAAVSKVQVITKTEKDNYGTKLIIEGGKTVLKEDIGCPVGTTFIITDLFYNVPARLKFLKSDISEATKINEIVISLSISTNNISFKFINNNKTIFKTPKTNNLKNVISSIYDKDLVNSLINIDYNNNGININGYISNLTYYRGSRKNQLLFVNNRYIKYKKASYYIEAAYNTLLPKDKHPACFLFISINPNFIDVNVHPAKTEIKIKDEELFLKEIKSAIYNSLRSINLIKEVTHNKFNSNIKKTEDNRIQNNQIFINENLNNSNNIIENDIFSDIALENFDLTTKSKLSYNISSNNSNKLDNFNNIDDGVFDNNKNIECNNKDIDCNENDNNMNNEYSNEENNNTNNNYNLTYKEINACDYVKENSLNNLINEKNKINEKNVIKNLKYIGILFKTYILCENSENNEFFIVDQHAAHERINYEKFLKQSNDKTIVLQELLVPEIINLSYDDYYISIENKDYFNSIGLSIGSFGKSDIIINSIPLVFSNINIKQLFFIILDSLKKSMNNNNLDIEIKKIAKKACTNSIKAGDILHDLEVKSLLDQLSNTDNPYTCPHGRPTIIKMTKYEIEKLFERIQN